MANNNSGTPRKFTLDGLPFNVAADSNYTMNFSPYEKEGSATTGPTFVKYTLRVPTIEGVSLKVNSADEDRLDRLSQRLDVFPISVTLASGATYKTTGTINYESFETEDAKAGLTVIPSLSIGAWTKFLA